MIATETREESQIKFGMVEKGWGGGVGWGGVLVFIHPSQKHDATALPS